MPPNVITFITNLAASSVSNFNFFSPLLRNDNCQDWSLLLSLLVGITGPHGHNPCTSAIMGLCLRNASGLAITDFIYQGHCLTDQIFGYQ